MDWNNNNGDIFPVPKKYWGIKVDKEREGDWSFGICLTRDSWLGEFYVYLNLFKWSISIGRLTKMEE